MGVAWQAALKSGKITVNTYSKLNKDDILASDYEHLSPEDKELYDLAYKLKYAPSQESIDAYNKLDPVSKSFVDFNNFANSWLRNNQWSALLGGFFLP